MTAQPPGRRKPGLGVVMPARDAAAFLAPALDSVLAQTAADFELVVVDDGSTDDTARILAAYAARDARIAVVRHERALGISAALNRGIETTRAGLIARMDADDVSAPERFARQLAFLAAHPDVVLCGTSARLLDERGTVSQVWSVPTGAATIRALLPQGNCFVHGSVMFRRQPVERAGLYSSDYPFAEDYELYVPATVKRRRAARPRSARSRHARSAPRRRGTPGRQVSTAALRGRRR
jgi:glycosyltransferase involved in cell wall biosynthesis